MNKALISALWGSAKFHRESENNTTGGAKDAHGLIAHVTEALTSTLESNMLRLDSFEYPEDTSPVSIEGLVSLSHDNSGATTITATLTQNAPITIYWRVAGSASFSAHSQSIDDNSANTHSVTINSTQGLTIEAYAEDHIGGLYTTPTGSISVPNGSSTTSFLEGQAFHSWALANGEVGKEPRVTTAMFTADKSGSIAQVRQYLIFTSAASSGYHAGTGGVIKLDIVNDDNGFPGSTVMATGTITPDLGGPNQINVNDPITMTSNAPLVAETKYHFVYSNIDPDPTANWLCIDGMWGQQGYALHWGDVSRDGPYTASINGGPWYVSAHQHIYQIDYTDGQYEGFGIFGGFGFSTQFDTSGANQVRQTCKFKADNAIMNCSVRMGRKSGNDPITMTVYNSAGVVMATDTVAASVVPVQAGTTPAEHEWIEFAGISGFTALASDTYYATLSTAASSVYHIHPMQMGKAYGFGDNTFGWYGEIAQQSVNSGGSWTGWTYNNSTNRQDAELGLFFNKGYAPVIA